VFHSTPVLVTPPVPTYLCDLGVINQCVPSLYDSRLEPGGNDAYASWLTATQYRTEFLLVGSNDGMLHAFNAGNDVVKSGVHSYDLGTGDEMWAFVPPDLLPKLIRYAIGDRHELLVDGTPMVRDVWVDANSDRKKQSSEYHTVAVVGEREGGRSYFALDVTDPGNPKFLWSFPPAGTNDSLIAGESWNDLGPAPPPIGPIAEADPSGAFKANGVAAHERYVVALGGGFDPAYLRGRAIYVLDVWTGQQIYRFSSADASGNSDPRRSLFPVAAPVSLADTDADGLFDTAVVGDTGGQVWTVGMGDPGRADGSGLYSNWYAARAFVQFDDKPFWHRSAFFQRAVLGLLPGNVWRLFMGAGDRDQIKDPNGGTCGLANLGACLRKNCNVTVTASKYRIGPTGSGGHYQSGSWSFQSGTTAPTASLASDSPPSNPSDSCSDVVEAKVDTSITCGNSSAQYSAQATCDWSPGGGG
jgi:type IV pilus assembly protein PilY1